jgi:hypothetical protein
MHRFRVVAFEHLLDTLDRSVQLADQIFIRDGEQIGKKSANLFSDLSVFLATGPYLKQILAIYRVANGDAHSHEQSTGKLKQPRRNVVMIRHQEIHIQAYEPSARPPERSRSKNLVSSSYSYHFVGLLSCPMSKASQQARLD